MILIFTNVRNSIDYTDFITQNVHPAQIDGFVLRGGDAFEGCLEASVRNANQESRAKLCVCVIHLHISSFPGYVCRDKPYHQFTCACSVGCMCLKGMAMTQVQA